MAPTRRFPTRLPYLGIFSLYGAFPEGADPPGGVRVASTGATENGTAATRSAPLRVSGLRNQWNSTLAPTLAGPLMGPPPLGGRLNGRFNGRLAVSGALLAVSGAITEVSH